MKNKKVTYLLLVLSIVIWGTAGWKVYNAFHTQPEVPTVKKEAKVVLKDSISLLLNYRDPFLGKYNTIIPSTDTAISKRKAVVNTIPSKQTPSPSSVTPDFQFKGTMNIGKNTMAILQRNGKVLTMKLGETVDGFKITKINDLMVVLDKDRKKYEIPIQ